MLSIFIHFKVYSFIFKYIHSFLVYFSVNPCMITGSESANIIDPEGPVNSFSGRQYSASYTLTGIGISGFRNFDLRNIFCHTAAKLWPATPAKTTTRPQITGNILKCLGKDLNPDSGERQIALLTGKAINPYVWLATLHESHRFLNL